MWEFLAVAYAVTVLQLRYSHAAVQQPANPFPAAAAHCYQRWRCYLASEMLLPTVHTVFKSTPNHVKKCSQHIHVKRMDAYAIERMRRTHQSMLHNLC
jgi:hypothetical protein